MSQQALRPEAVKFLSTLARCGNWHINTSKVSANLAMAQCLVGEGLVKLDHHYRRPSGGFAVYSMTAEGTRQLSAALETERLRKAVERRAMQARANMNSAF